MVAVVDEDFRREVKRKNLLYVKYENRKQFFPIYCTKLTHGSDSHFDLYKSLKYVCLWYWQWHRFVFITSNEMQFSKEPACLLLKLQEHFLMILNGSVFYRTALLLSLFLCILHRECHMVQEKKLSMGLTTLSRDRQTERKNTI